MREGGGGILVPVTGLRVDVIIWGAGFSLTWNLENDAYVSLVDINQELFCYKKRDDVPMTRKIVLAICGHSSSSYVRCRV